MFTVRRFAPVAIAAMVAFVSACGANTQSGNESGSSPAAGTGAAVSTQETQKPVKLRIYWWGSQNRHDATQKAMEAYTKLNPHITFEPEFSGWDGYFDKMATMTAAGNMPDIIQIDSFYLEDYAKRNTLADLSTGVNTADIPKALLDSGKYKDKLYAIPLGNNALGYAYNKKTFDNTGIALPQNGWTWADFKKTAADLKAKLGDGKYVTMDYTREYLNYEAYQLSKGKGFPITADGKFNFDKEAFLEHTKMYEEFRKNGIVPPADISVTHKEFDPKMDLLANGMVQIRHLYSAQYPTLSNLVPDTFALVTYPKNEQPSGWLKPSMFWSASAKSAHVEEAKKFINWFVNDQAANEILLSGGRGTPASTKMVNALESKFSETDKVANKTLSIIAENPAPFNAGAAGWANFRDKDFKAVGEKVMFGKITPEQAWEELVTLSKQYQ
jgi:multiple sugar transport system substrate-binding protein